MSNNKIIEFPINQKGLTDFFQLTKLRLSISVVMSSMAGYFLAVDIIDFFTLFLLTVGGFSMVGASNVFNQIFEKDLDKLMPRTQNRPLPDERMQIKTAMLIGVILTLVGILSLYLINIKTAFFASISTFLYTCLYTPLKQKNTTFSLCRSLSRSNPFYAWMGSSNK